MSIEIRYKMNHGNNIFQYICARLFAERNGLWLETPFNRPRLVRMAPHKDGRIVTDPPFTITDNHDVLDRRWPPRRYVFDGYFQRSYWYHEARVEIERFAFVQDVPKAPEGDIVMNLRLGDDYKGLNWCIHPSWYLAILSREDFNRLHIVVDKIDPGYLEYFSRYSPIVVHSGVVGDWNYLRSFDRIICSNSTFCWWAAYFSSAKRIYTFKRWVRSPIPRIGPFPNGIEVDGPFLHELNTESSARSHG
jgi:hypothetical protein